MSEKIGWIVSKNPQININVVLIPTGNRSIHFEQEHNAGIQN